MSPDNPSPIQTSPKAHDSQHADAAARSATGGQPLDVAIVGGGLAGVVALAYARAAGLSAIVLERAGRVGGLWRDLPAWQDIQISAADWALGALPLHGVTQPHILTNIEAWVDHFALADGIRLNAPVQSAVEVDAGWALTTPQGVVHARHLVAATGAHNTPVIPPVARASNAPHNVREFHSSALRDPSVLAGQDVLVVGGGASAFDLLELCFQQGAKRVVWAYRGTKWFVPTKKTKAHCRQCARVRQNAGQWHVDRPAKRCHQCRHARALRKVRHWRHHAGA